MFRTISEKIRSDIVDHIDRSSSLSNRDGRSKISLLFARFSSIISYLLSRKSANRIIHCKRLFFRLALLISEKPLPGHYSMVPTEK